MLKTKTERLFIIIIVSFLAPLSDFSKVSSEPIVNFFCEYDQEVPTTFGTNNKGDSQPLFRWKQENLPGNAVNSQEACKSITKNLNSYFSSTNHSSSKIRLLYSDREVSSGEPIVCISSAKKPCDFFLLYVPSNLPGHFDGTRFFLESILDKTLQTIWTDNEFRQTLYVDIDLFNEEAADESK